MRSLPTETLPLVSFAVPDRDSSKVAEHCARARSVPLGVLAQRAAGVSRSATPAAATWLRRHARRPDACCPSLTQRVDVNRHSAPRLAPRSGTTRTDPTAEDSRSENRIPYGLRRTAMPREDVLTVRPLESRPLSAMRGRWSTFLVNRVIASPTQCADRELPRPTL